MKKLDKKYLTVQFRLRIHTKNGKEFQSFFESIMEKAYKDFQKIKPYGKKGDGGNDGYRKDAGIYYQVYSPETPKINEATAAKKLKDDFHKLQKVWNEISNIKEYYFVFNDKYGGSVQPVEQALSDLEKDNPGITFRPFLAKDLEKTFFKLDASEMLDLDFHIDQREAIAVAYEFLDGIRDELDRENAVHANRVLEHVKKIITLLEDENLLLEIEILEGICLQKLEKFDEAKVKYESLLQRHPNDARPLLYLSEIYLNDKDLEKNLSFLQRAESIDKGSWLLKLEKLVRHLHLGEQIDVEAIDEKSFPDDPKTASSFYRLYALAYEFRGDKQKADTFISKAIQLHPYRFSNYNDELTVTQHRMLEADDDQRLQLAQELLRKVENVERQFSDYADIGARNKANLNIYKLNAYLAQENTWEIEKISRETFSLSLACYFNSRIEIVITGLLQLVAVPDAELNRLLQYLKGARNKVSDELIKVLVVQFNFAGKLFTAGRAFFREVDQPKILELIDHLEKEEYEQATTYILSDVPFAIAMANSLKEFSELRRKIIENLPEDKNIQKDKLWLLLYSDEKDFDKALEILKCLNLSDLNYSECRPMLQVARHKKAWEFEVTILEKLLPKEKKEKEHFYLRAQLLFALLNLKKYTEVIDIGKQLLAEDFSKRILDPKDKEALLTNTLYACLERSKVARNALDVARALLKEYLLETPSFEFKAGIEAEVYISDNDFENGLRAVVDGVKIKKTLSPQEYARLYYHFIRIGNQINLNPAPLEIIQANTFVKLDGRETWYSVSDETELDAIGIPKSSSKYQAFIGKKLGEIVTFDNPYSSEKSEAAIELIYPIEEYIFWQTARHFHRLAREGVLDWVQVVDVPQEGESVDISNIAKWFENLNSRTEPMFELFCQGKVPLAVLAASEGSLPNAVARIQHEGNGFINFSDGTIQDLEKQMELARKIVRENLPFYLDGTSAMFLSESGVLKKIHKYIPGVKTTQSVLHFLADVAHRFQYTPGHSGYMGYHRGKLTMSPFDREKSNRIRSNFIESIVLLESNTKNIIAISAATKIDCLSESKVAAELCDACVLAQKEGLAVLTEDYRYLQMNALETKKEVPQYFSSIALLRVLYEENQISFDEYLDYFGYLSSYRFRFLNMNSYDIEKAIFGDGVVKIVRPNNVQKLNFPLTLSEEYGVQFQVACRVVAEFLFRILTDDSVTTEVAENIFFEIMESVPSKIGKRQLGRLLVGVCNQIIENRKSKLLFYPEHLLVEKKIDALLRISDIYSSGMKLWTPNDGPGIWRM